ncbi:MAG: tetratricopeptide repeat protein [Acidobacteriota bacterium]
MRAIQPLRLALSAGLVLAFAGLGACSGGDVEPPASSLVAVASADLDTFDPPVRRQFEAAHGAWLAAAAAPAAERATLAGEWGRLLHAYGRLDAAADAYAVASSLAPEDFGWAYLRGVALQEQGSSLAALPALRGAVALAPADVSVQLRLARALIEVADWDAAKSTLERALEADPNSAMAYFLAGDLEMARGGDPHVALVAYDFALKLQPQASVVHGSLARAFADLGDDDRAAFHRLRQGAAPIRVDDPLRTSIEALDISAAKDLERAHFYRRLGQTGEALRYYRRAVETAPSNARARSALGAILAETGDLDGAVDEMRKASRLAAADPAVIANLAEVHRIRGELDAAAAGHRRVLELRPDDVRAHLGLARALAASEHADEAILHYETVLRQAPGHPEAAAELQRLLNPSRG